MAKIQLINIKGEKLKDITLAGIHFFNANKLTKKFPYL